MGDCEGRGKLEVMVASGLTLKSGGEFWEKRIVL
jgi:hypothetical protein